jgi:hypothetical protein
MQPIAFNEFPNDARLWTFAATRRLVEDEGVRLLATTEAFLAGWAAHQTPLATAHEWRFDQFLFVAVDEAAAGASGCSIDALVTFVRELERQFEVRFTDHGSVWFRDQADAIQCVKREEFQQLVDGGTVGPNAMVFDNTIQTVGALRNGRWEVSASRSWHGQAFFPTHSANAK